MREKINALQANIHAACRAGVLMILVITCFNIVILH
jgi:hypothetical protein